MRATDVLYDPMMLAFVQAILMLIFLAGAWSKLRARETFEGVVYNYRLLPEFAVLPASYLLPMGELAVGLGLAYSPARPYAAVGAIVLLTVFNIAIAVNLLRGRREIDCGCFSSVLKQHLSWWLIVRNLGLVALAGWLAWGVPGTLAEPIGWLDWTVGLAMALAVTLVYMTATLLTTQAKLTHNTRQTG
jgi:hypothetical protein